MVRSTWRCLVRMFLCVLVVLLMVSSPLGAMGKFVVSEVPTPIPAMVDPCPKFEFEPSTIEQFMYLKADPPWCPHESAAELVAEQAVLGPESHAFPAIDIDLSFDPAIEWFRRLFAEIACNRHL